MPDNTLSTPISLQERIRRAQVEYPALWSKVTREWREESRKNNLWLTYSANYLLHTAGVHWGIDPYSYTSRTSGMDQPDYVKDLAEMELIVLTHAHRDHLDMDLIRALSSLPIQWVIPEAMQSLIFSKSPLKPDKVITPKNGTTITFRNLQLTSFDSFHYHKHGGIEETGYLVKFENEKWLFPADIRDFDRRFETVFPHLDGIVAHLWLGKAKAMESTPPLLGKFCSFFNSLSPSRLLIAHLNELGRVENEMWTERHFYLVKQEMKKMNPQIQIEMVTMGNHVIL
jgi:hypothetical protein